VAVYLAKIIHQRGWRAAVSGGRAPAEEDESLWKKRRKIGVELFLVLFKDETQRRPDTTRKQKSNKAAR
jgi:hypothetical protein